VPSAGSGPVAKTASDAGKALGPIPFGKPGQRPVEYERLERNSMPTERGKRAAD